MPLGNKSFENTEGKGETARNEQFLLFPVFSTHLDNFLPFSSNWKLSSANSSSLSTEPESSMKIKKRSNAGVKKPTDRLFWRV